MVRVIRNITAAAVVALALAGCGSGSDTAAAPETTAGSEASTSAAATTSGPAARDDQLQIRDLVTAQTEAFGKGDWNALAELTCTQFREQARNPGKFLVPPMDTFGAREQLATLGVAQVSELLGQQFGTAASKATLDRVAQAIVAYDEPAYQAAMLDLVTESTTVTVDKVDNIKIAGDTASADITSTHVMGDNPPQTSTDNTPYLREGGKWLDCSNPTE